MIAASEPLEFIPHGRRAVARHPASAAHAASNQSNQHPDSLLLFKLRNVAISDNNVKRGAAGDPGEWWQVRQICASKGSADDRDSADIANLLNPAKTTSADTTAFVTPNVKLRKEFNSSIRSEMNASKRLKCDNDQQPATSDEASTNCSTDLFRVYEPHAKTDCCYEEELYVKDRTAVWSRGLISNPNNAPNESESRTTVTSYTCESPIKHALFCNFHAAVNDRLMLDALSALNGEFKSSIKIGDNLEDDVRDNPVPCICVIDSSCLRAFTETGEDFIASLQFQVKRAWSTKYGVLLEKEAAPAACGKNSTRVDLSSGVHTRANSTKINSNLFSPDTCNTFTEPDIPLPTCFSLTHPLDEMAPVLTKTSLFGAQYYNDGNMQIVFVSESPSLGLTYNKKTGLHALWRIRKATSEECHALCGNFNKTSTIFSQSTQFNPMSPFESQKTPLPSRNSTGLMGVSTPYLTRSSSSQLKSNMSPMAGRFDKLGLTPHTSLGQASNSSMHATNINASIHPQPLYPDVCFDHVWTENLTRSNPASWSAASKAFLHRDHVGQHYLCYLISGSVNQLFTARLERPRSAAPNDKIIVGVVTSINAKDAVNVPSTNLMAVVDLSGNIILYSGLFMIGKVHIGGVLAGLINSPYNQTKKLDTSFPRRSSLKPTYSKDVVILDDSALHQLSPVPHKSDKKMDFSGLQRLRDPISNRITLEYERGLYYRIALPELASSSLVYKCITSLKQILPKDTIMQVISKWYGIRNAPGTQDLCTKLEWSMFVSLILSLLGYDISKLTLTKQPDIGNIEIMIKKQKTSNDGSQDDWEYLLKSSHHLNYGNSLATLLNLKSSITLAGNSKGSLEINTNVQKYAELGQLCQMNSSEMDTTNQEFSVPDSQHKNFNSNSLLFPYILQILYSFHLLYEDLKLNVLLVEDLQPLAQFLHQICADLNLENYLTHYWKDFPLVCHLKEAFKKHISEKDMKKISQPAYFNVNPPNIFQHFYTLLNGQEDVSYPYLNDVNVVSRDIVEILGLIANGVLGVTNNINPKDGMASLNSTLPSNNFAHIDSANVDQIAALLLCSKSYTLKDIQNFPPAINFFMLNALSRCKQNPPANWPPRAYSLIMREDLALRAQLIHKTTEDDDSKENSFTLHKIETESQQANSKAGETEKNTGLEHIDTKILRLRFPDDHRVTEVCNLLQSSVPVSIALTQRPEVSDHDFIEEQERHLYALCTRTMALPVGRGMVTLRSSSCIVTEPLQIPKLCLTGRAPPRNSTIELSHIEVPPHHSAWPLFHNGVAAGLKLVPMGSAKIESAWVVYNKPKQGTSDMLYEHAGFLMALGLNGHLKDMAFMDMYEYLVKCHEMTSVGLLLGIAATYRGTMDISTTKLMGIHVEALLPPTSIELDIPQNIQVAALLSVGLLYQKTAHTHITQVLLSEIGRPPGPEMENSSEREGYSLAAGLGLGLVCLGAHKTAPHHLTSTLRHYMLGGNKRPLTGAQKEKYKLPSFQIREGTTVNVDVTAPGATLALGMLYLKSGNTEVAKWLAPPPTHYLLDFVRPDLLLLRVIARGLILWDSIEPTEDWVENYVPASVKPYCFVKPVEDHIDYEAMNQVYCNIVAGACFSIGLRFAGSANQEACDTILFFAKEFTKLGLKSIGELAGKSTIETCLNLILISAAMVMAGTGDLEIMKLCRQQRARAGPLASSLTYGSQLAVHSALGLLYLGAGRYTLSTTPESIAALICAFFPKFPTHSNDNRYHLQAFRHLYVLATEPRLVIPRDIQTGALCYANIRLITLTNKELNMKAPCLLPELDSLKEVHIDDPRYWPIVFRRDMNWDQLLPMLQNLSCIDIKRRAGCLSYLEDPQGFQRLLSYVLALDNPNVWLSKLKNIQAFSTDDSILNFTRHYLIDSLSEHLNTSDGKIKKPEASGPQICSQCFFINLKRFSSPKSNGADDCKKCVCDKNNADELEFVQQLLMVTYECVVRDNLIMLPSWITFLKMLKELKCNPTVYHVWQLKILNSQMENHRKKQGIAARKDGAESLTSNEFTASLRQKIKAIMDDWEPHIVKPLQDYMKNCSEKKYDISELHKIVSYITYYDIPKGVFGGTISDSGITLIDLLARGSSLKLNPACMLNILRLFESRG